RRIPARERGIAQIVALTPVFRAMLREDFVGERGDRREAESGAFLEIGTVPLPRRQAQRVARTADQIGAVKRREPEIMAHPDIVDDAPSVAELADVAEQPGRRLRAVVVETGRHGEAVRRHDDIADLQHGALARAENIADLYPAL